LILKNKRRTLRQKVQSCERNTQELGDSMKRPNLSFMGIEEGEEV
jgi:hypothetical protein